VVSTTFHRYPTLPGAFEDALSPIHTTVLIPVYNEEAALPRVLEDVFANVGPGYEILVVDDGSSDGTIAVAQAYPCRVVSHEANRGKGAAMRTGLPMPVARRSSSLMAMRPIPPAPSPRSPASSTATIWCAVCATMGAIRSRSSIAWATSSSIT